jgi:NAD(P)-dependent dehydrogenase (short-subunit alcohol dehydrogenase family)
VIPALRARGGGAIVNTSSVAGLRGNAIISAYVASKHAVIGLTRSAAQAYGADGIRTNAICPSPIETRMMRSLEEGFPESSPEEVKEMMESRIPLGRYGTPEEVASLVAFLCSDDARFMNGGVYTIDGGMTSA